MVNCRALSLDVIDTERFMDMPGSARLLYYDLCVRVDRQGFTNHPRAIARATGASPCDLELLIVKGFAQPEENGLRMRW